jgi:hypothetical protein
MPGAVDVQIQHERAIDIPDDLAEMAERLPLAAAHGTRS